MNNINLNLNNTHPSLEDSRRRLKELNLEKRELDIKSKLSAPMTDHDYHRAERIGADIAQVEFFIEWLENSEDDDWS